MVRHLRNAHAAGGLPFAFSAAHALALVDRHIAEPNLLALVCGHDGLLLASAQEHPFAAIRYAMETVWWIAPEGRGRSAGLMLASYEAWAREQHCAFTSMASLASFPRAGIIYRRAGYREAETHYLKPLG